MTTTTTTKVIRYKGGTVIPKGTTLSVVGMDIFPDAMCGITLSVSEFPSHAIPVGSVASRPDAIRAAGVPVRAYEVSTGRLVVVR